ncbi:MAG TPA: hypothetical protein VJU83_05395 [Burkholderiales bacterium]|nr:hypothetical protein [Burkholderiales bacterium]
MWNYAGIVLGIGALLILFEWNIARKKKGGLTWTDKQRIFGIVKITLILTALAAFIGYALE